MENKKTKTGTILMIVFFLLQTQFIMAQIVPDTSINGKIFLLNVKSVKTEMGDVMAKLNDKKDLPDVYFSNKTKSQYLRMIFHAGSFKNSFSMFEVGYISPKIKVKNKLKYSIFYTERNIKLGMTKTKFLSIMGKNVKKNSFDNSYLLRIDEPNNSFLEMYGLPIYEAKYFFKNNILIKFYFGFKYP
jgi:hypothetical protein